MTCCQCQGIESSFNRERAQQDLARYREKGPNKTTRILLEALEAEGIEGLTLLDIGGGIGVIQHELLAAGASRAISVEASSAFFEAAREEAERRQHSERIRAYHGNFVDLAPDIPPADIVTLDRVICCYHDMEALVGLSAARAQKFYGLVYPRDSWWVKAVIPLINFYFRLRRNPFRVFAHPTEKVDAVVQQQGLTPHFYRTTAFWQIVVYARQA